QAADIAAGDLKFVTIPTNGRESNARGDVVLVEPRAVEEFIERHIAEQEATERAAAEAAAVQAAVPPPPPDLVASRYVVDVRNGSRLSGMAANVADHLRGLGFARGVVDNTAATETSVVDRKSTRLNSSHVKSSYAVFCLKTKT